MKADLLKNRLERLCRMLGHSQLYVRTMYYVTGDKFASDRRVYNDNSDQTIWFEHYGIEFSIQNPDTQIGKRCCHKKHVENKR